MPPIWLAGPSRAARWVVCLGCGAAALLVLLVPVTAPSALVLSGLVATAAGFAAAARSSRSDRWSWTLLGFSQLLNGLGNINYVPGWWHVPGWLASTLFNGATVAMLLGLWTLLSPTRSWRSILGYTADLLVLNACVFVLIWSSEAGDGPDAVTSSITLLALVMDLLGVLLLPLLLRSRPARSRTPVLLAWLAMLAATIGDNDGITTVFQLHRPLTPALLWVASSLLIIVGAVFVDGRDVRLYTVHRTLTLYLALASLSATAFLVIWSPVVRSTGPVGQDRLGAAVLTAAVALVFARCVVLVVGNSLLTRRLATAAWTDPLTGLANRRRFEVMLADRLESAGAATVLFCDLDGFKEVNDSYGHRIGDGLLVTIAARLSTAVGPDTLLARVGGDEFTALLPCRFTSAQTRELAAELQLATAEPVVLDERTVSVTMSVGVTADDHDTAEQIMTHADLALYAAKAAGGGSCRDYQPAMVARKDRRHQAVQRFREAMAGGGFDFDYQPIVDLVDFPTVIRREALLRWRGDAAGEVFGPTEILATAAELSALAELTEMGIEAVVAAAAGWPACDGAAVALNLNAEQLDLPDLTDVIDRALVAHELPAHRLCVEITEHALLSSTARSTVLPWLRDHGIRIALDDFGTGYANFISLIELPVDELKLDRSFLTSATSDDTGRRESVLSAVVQMAHRIGLTVTMEGVETTDQLDLSRRLGADHVQGFLTGRPGPLPNPRIAAAPMSLHT